MNVIEATKVNRSFVNGKETTHVLKDIDLTVEKGEFVSIMGPSGSGKTVSGLEQTQQLRFTHGSPERRRVGQDNGRFPIRRDKACPPREEQQGLAQQGRPP